MIMDSIVVMNMMVIAAHTQQKLLAAGKTSLPLSAGEPEELSVLTIIGFWEQ